MIKRFIPFATAKNIYEIDRSFFEKFGIKVIFSDLDNTLDNFAVNSPSEETKKLKEKLESWGIKMIILSNNTSSRVGNYASELGVEYRCRMHKPFSKRLKAFVKERGYSFNEVALIGDQIITDTIAGNGAGIKVIFCERLTDSEPLWTNINRIFERPIKKRLIKKNLLISWRNK